METERPAPRASTAKKAEVKEAPEIREALTHVGELMRLPPKRPGAAEAAAAMLRKAKELRIRAQNPKILLPTLAILTAIIFASVKMWPEPDLMVPSSLQREWVTSHPKYAGNRIAFTSTQVLITIGQGGTTSYPIDKITSQFRGDSTKVIVSYIDQGAPVDLEASVVSIPTPRLIFARPEGLVWEPTGK
ncbi:MAG: hypothetical protein IT357_03135 [Gemmatimonadaceae bacterium]|nr:hypothetical protein [Gemmatimonadaceae bacterium]